jgi:hypothetical protein
MCLEDLERFPVLLDDLTTGIPDKLANAVGGNNSQFPIALGLDDDGRSRGVAEPLEFTGDDDNVAVAEATDLDDLHSRIPV